MNDKQIHIRVNDELYNEIQKQAQKTGRSVQDCLTSALINMVKNQDNDIPKKEGKYKFIDLFAGIGGMRLAYEANGCECVYSNEWNKYSQQTYFANFGEMPDGDITKVNEYNIPNHDILVAGFPCQPFSIAGVSKKNSLGRATGFQDKTQGTLFFDVCRILKAKRPKAFMLENVKNLKSHDRGRTFKIRLCHNKWLVFDEK
nr:DNA (cytosine-5-)-methyltransferase [Acidaminococcus fermentans]